MNIPRNFARGIALLIIPLSLLAAPAAFSQVAAVLPRVVETTNQDATWVQITNLPEEGGTFWSWQLSPNFPPSPYDPWPELPLYELEIAGSTNSLGQYLYDDRSVGYSNDWAQAARLASRESSHGGEMEKMDDGPAPPGGGGGEDTNYSGGGGSEFTIPDYTVTSNYSSYSNYWLTIAYTNTNTVLVGIESTLPGLTYLIITNSTLSGDGWEIWERLTASSSFTPAPPLAIGPGNLFFEAVLVWSSCTNYSPALPDWWALQYFDSACVDPGDNPSGDGIDNWDKYVLGLNPNVAYVSPLVVSPPGGNYVATPSIRIFSLAGESIKYTTDGSLPSATHGTPIGSGEVLSNLPSGSFTLKGWESGSLTNIPLVAAYTIIPGTPVISLPSGVYGAGTTLQITPTVSNEVVRYTTNGVAPTSGSAEIFATNVLTLVSSETVMASAWAGTNSSPVAAAEYIVDGPPSNDDFSNAIALSGLSGEFRGTTVASTLEAFETNDYDGYFGGQASDGNSVWYKWTAPSNGSVFIDYSRFREGTFILPYVATNSGTLPTNLVPATVSYDSDYTSMLLTVTQSVTYYFALSDEISEGAFDVLWQYVGATPTPIFTPDAGTYLTPELVTVSDDETDAVIYYTLNGSTPTTNSAVISSGATLLITNTETVKAAAWRAGLSESAIKTALYTINASATNPTLTASAPVITPTNQTFSSSLTVTLTCTNGETVVYYTLDGSEPSLASLRVSSGGTVTITNSAIVSAVSWATNMNLSPVSTAEYAKAGSYTAGDGIPDSGKLAIGANILAADAGSVNPNPLAHGLDNMQVYQNPSVLLADNYSTLDDGIPDWWLVSNGYSVTSPASSLGANGQTLLTSYLAGLNPNNPNSRPGQLPSIDFHMVNGPSNAMVMVLDNVSSNIVSYFLTCTPTDTSGNPAGAAVMEQMDSDTAMTVAGQTAGRFFQMTNQLSSGYWEFTLQGVSSNGLWSSTSSNTFATANEIVSGGTEYDYWLRNVGLPVSVAGYTNVNAEKEPDLVQILRAESDVFQPDRYFEDQGGFEGLAAANWVMIYNNRVPGAVTTEQSWGTLTFQFDFDAGDYSSIGYASYFTAICATPDLGMDCGTVYTNFDYYNSLIGGSLSPLFAGYGGAGAFFLMPDDSWGDGYRFNAAGLEYSNLTYRISGQDPVTLNPGDSNNVPDTDFTFEVSLNTETPALQTVGYYFDGRDYPVSSSSGGDFTQTCPPLLSGATTLDGWIGSVPVSVTNPVIVAQVGKPAHLQGWSTVMAVRPNGTPLTNQLYGIQQDFDQAYLCDPTTGDVPRTTQTNYNGDFMIDTNSAVKTGILSPGLSYAYNTTLPYQSQATRSADFTPTQPGKVIVTTMPDANGFYGEVTVYVIDMRVDANHDGIMDNRDLTSVNNPDVFWANNDYDRTNYDSDDKTFYDDSVQSAPTTDAYYQDPSSGQYAVPTIRDLVDYFRLWLPGLSNMVANLPTNYTVTLQWRNNSGAAVRIFRAAETNGGTNYLFDQVTGTEQTNYPDNPCYGYVSPSQTIALDQAFASTTVPKPSDYFIFCGAAAGNDELVCQVKNPYGGVVGEASVFLNIKDIKQMYERWSVGESISVPPNDIATNCGDGGSPSFQYPYDSSVDSTTPYILYVHGWNMQTWEKDRFAESAYKRLYWQGYQGRFGVYRWPTGNGFAGWSTLISDTTEKDNYDLSEYQAWQSGIGLKTRLTALDIQYPGQVYMLAHSMGNVVAGESLRLAGTTNLVNTYVASQAAITAQTYDSTVTNYSFYDPPFSYDADTPNIDGNWFATNNGNSAKQVISFYNVNDYALARGRWQTDQLLKPDQLVAENNGTFNYGYSGSTNDPPPWNHFYKDYANGELFTNFDIVNILKNRYEVMALAAQPYTTALGATPGVHNLGGSIDLTLPQSQAWPTPDPFGNNFAEHFWHSAEFRGDYWMQQGYWNQLLGPSAFGLK